MSSFALFALGCILVSHGIIYPGAASQSVASHGDNDHSSSRSQNLDLIELSPSLESQLDQAKRLSGADSESRLELNKPGGSDDDERYDLMASNKPGQSRSMSLIRDPNAAWSDRVHMSKNSVRRRSEDWSAQQQQQQQQDNYNNRISRENSAFGFTNRNPQFDWARSLRDYDDSQSVLSLADNHESASRESLGTSNLLRDLLIAGQARARARYLDQLTRNYELERAKGAKSGIYHGSAGRPSYALRGGPWYSWFWNDNYERGKRRRCAVDPNIGIKNPSYCDTDHFFGASEYDQGQIWETIGR